MNLLEERFGPVVRAARSQKGWSQEQLAEAVDLNRSYLGEIERGQAMPTLSTAARLAVALDTRLSSLLLRCES